jgi:hypothetical protein
MLPTGMGKFGYTCNEPEQRTVGPTSNSFEGGASSLLLDKTIGSDGLLPPRTPLPVNLTPV